MDYREKAGQSITEPVTVAEMKTYMGLANNTDSDDALLTTIIKSARLWLEEYTGLSVVSKSYEVRFYREDSYRGYYPLPYSPVTSITSAEINGTAVEYEEKGLDKIMIKPATSIITGTTSEESYMDVEFIAGADNELANLAIKRIVNDMWNNRADNMPAGVVDPSWGTMRYIDSLSNNTGL
jgi:uncharacterized phiE125 gp8 family phage protein